MKDRQKLKNRLKENKKPNKNMRTIGDYDIDLDNHIGFGTFGTVYRAYKHGNEECAFACKLIHEKKIANMGTRLLK